MVISRTSRGCLSARSGINKYLCRYFTYNCDFSSIQWLKESDMAEIILAPLDTEETLQACHCKDSLAQRFDSGEFHDEDCMRT